MNGAQPNDIIDKEIKKVENYNSVMVNDRRHV